MKITDKIIKDYMISQDVGFGCQFSGTSKSLNDIQEFEVTSFVRIYGKAIVHLSDTHKEGFHLLITCTYIECGTTRFKFFEYREDTIISWVITKRDQNISTIINI